MSIMRKIFNIVKFIIEFILLIVLFYLVCFKKFNAFLAVFIIPIMADIITSILFFIDKDDDSKEDEAKAKNTEKEDKPSKTDKSEKTKNNKTK